MTIREWMERNTSRFPNKQVLLNQACKECKCTKDSARKAYNKVSLKPTQVIGLSEKDIRAKHDNMFKIREGIKRLKKGIFLTDQQMRDFCKISANVWRGYSEHPDFEKYKYRPTSKDIYWATPETIDRVSDITY